MERAKRLKPLLEIFAESMPSDDSMAWYLLATIVAIDEAIEFATTKGTVQ
jgi:hypothetical protein